MNRRNFCQGASWTALAQLAGVSPLRPISLLAQSNSSAEYKALVCIFLRGGNDSNNMIVPLNSVDYSHYFAARGPLGVPQSGLLQMAGQAYGFHPAFVNLKNAFSGGRAAIVANVGPLAQPTTIAEYQASTVLLPESLMSHEGQQQEWESGSYLSGFGPGWAGLMADQLQSTYNSANLPLVTLLGPSTNFGLGKTTAPLTVPGGSQHDSFWCSAGNSCYARAEAAQQLLTFNTGVSLVQADQLIYKSAYKYNAFYNSVLAGATPLKTAFPTTNGMAAALQTIATMIQLRRQIGASRQVFLLDFGSFDTHSAQLGTQAALFSQLDQAIGIFINAMEELGVYKNVTLFSASDFNRTLRYNSSLGTDHAWGGHHFVVGGAVKGGVYGSFPSLELNGANDIDGSGRWLPTTALSQYTATLASWFGVPTTGLSSIFPGLSNFSSANLGFV